MKVVRYWLEADEAGVHKAARTVSATVVGEIVVSQHLRPLDNRQVLPGKGMVRGPHPPRRLGKREKIRPWERTWRWQTLALFNLQGTDEAHTCFQRMFLYVETAEPEAPPRRELPPIQRRLRPKERRIARNAARRSQCQTS